MKNFIFSTSFYFSPRQESEVDVQIARSKRGLVCVQIIVALLFDLAFYKFFLKIKIKQTSLS